MLPKETEGHVCPQTHSGRTGLGYSYAAYEKENFCNRHFRYYRWDPGFIIFFAHIDVSCHVALGFSIYDVIEVLHVVTPGLQGPGGW